MDILAQLTIKAPEIAIPMITADSNLFNRILGLVYVLIAATALFYIVRGALLFVTNGSEPNTVKQARETILYAVGALFGSTLVFVLIQFIIKSVGGVS